MIKATVTDIIVQDQISEVKFLADFGEIYALSLELSPTLQVGSEVLINFKSSELFISKTKPVDITIRNIFKVKIKNITFGKIVSNLSLYTCKSKFDTIISTHSVKRLNLQVDDEVYGCVKSSSVYISEIL